MKDYLCYSRDTYKLYCPWLFKDAGSKNAWRCVDARLYEYRKYKEVRKMNKIIASAIENTKSLVPGYFEKTCAQRLADGTGSIFEDIHSVEDMEQALLSAEWIPAEHECVAPDCRAFKTTSIKSGLYGMVKVADQPDDTIFVIEDQKNTGKVSLVMKGNHRIPAEETWIILGPEQGKEVVYTFHPGEPIPRATTSTEELPVGTEVTKEEAMALGFNLAKVG